MSYDAQIQRVNGPLEKNLRFNTQKDSDQETSEIRFRFVRA